MSSPIDSGGSDYSSLYGVQQTAAPIETTAAADPTILAKSSDTISQSTAVTGPVGQYSGDTGSPQLFPYDPQAAAASDKAMQGVQDSTNTAANQTVQSFLTGQSPELQHAVLTDSPDPSVQQLTGQLNAQAQTAALANLGLQTVQPAQPLSLSNLQGVPQPGPVSPAANPETKVAQLLSNTLQSTQNASSIAQAQLGQTANSDSVMAFLKAIGDAIGELKTFLGTLNQSDITGKWGHDITSLMDWNAPAAEAQAEMEDQMKQSSSDSGGLSLPGMPDLGPLNDVVNTVVNVVSSVLSKFVNLLFSFTSMKNPLSNLLNKQIPVVSDLLNACASMTKGIPFVGNFMQEVANKPMVGVLALGGAMLIMPLTMTLGPFALILAGLAFSAVFAISGNMAGDASGSNKSGTPGMGPSPAGGGGNLPIVGDMLKQFLGMFSGVPILGDLANTAGDNQSLVALSTVAGLAVAATTMAMGPFGLLLAGSTSAAVMGGGLMAEGKGGQIPIIGDLFNGGSTAAKPASTGDPEVDNAKVANRQQGSAQAASNTARLAAEQMAKDKSDSTDSDAQMIALVMQLIALLTHLQAAAQGGAQGSVSSGQVPMDQLTGVLNQFNATGLANSKLGDLSKLAQPLQDAQKKGEAGDISGMLDELTKTFASLGVDTQKMGAAMNYVTDDLKSEQNEAESIPAFSIQQAA